METFLIKAAQLILALTILVIIHEFGHFLFARLFGVKVEKFYIFFNPWTTLFKWRPGKYVGWFNKKKKLKSCPADFDINKEDFVVNKDGGKQGEPKKSFWKNTEYGVGWLPLGGYCKIAGMIDESMDTEQMKQPAKEWEFRSKPAWQRLLIMAAGVLFNFLLAILIYAGIVFVTGEKYVPYEKATMGYVYSPEAKKIGFQDGDIPLSADGVKLYNPAEDRIKIVQAKEVEVLRDGKVEKVQIPEKFIFKLDDEMKNGKSAINLMEMRMPVQVKQVVAGEGAAKAGIQEGDRIIAINDTPTESLDLFFPALADHPDEDVKVTVVRNLSDLKDVKDLKVAPDTLQVNVHLSEGSKMGIGLEVDPSKFFECEDIEYNLFQSIPRGVKLGTDMLVNYAQSMKLIFTKEGAKSVGGFGSIGDIFPKQWDWVAFWNIAAFLSVILAFMNILPIPALDGGHILFLLIEVITGKQLPEKFIEWAQMVGMGLLLALLIYANAMDIFKFFIK